MKTNLDDDEEIYSSMKKAMREMKSNITVNDKDNTKEKPKEENQTYYGYRNRQNRPEYQHERPKNKDRRRKDINRREDRIQEK